MALKASRPVYRWKDSCNRKDADIESDTVSEINDTTLEKVIMQLNKKREYNTSLKTSLTGKQEIETASSSSTGDEENTIADKVQGLEGTEADDDAASPDYDGDEIGEAEIDTSVFILTRDSRRTFDKFEKWILSPDGGEKDPKPAALAVRQVQKVLIILGTENIESLFNTALIRDKFYPESRATVKAGTTVSYLHSLRKFYIFAMTEDDVGLSQECRKAADVLYRKCGEWCKSLSKDVKLSEDSGKNKRKICLAS